MIDFFSVGSLTYKMLVLTLSTFFTVVSTLTRSSIDYNTVVGNCSAERPVFGRPVKGGEIGCYGKFDMIETLSYQRIQFFEVNYARWLEFRHVRRSLMFDGYQWVNAKFTVFHRRVLIVPSSGQLLYMEDRHDRHQDVR